MIILFAGQKGGSGKSTLASNFAAWLASTGADVMLVDADRQGTCSRWAEYREEDDSLPVVHSVQKYERITRSLKDLNARYEYVVCDVAGRDSQEMRSAFLAANVAVIPFRPSQADLDTLPHVAEIVAAATDLNPSLVCYALLTLAPTNPVVNEAKEAASFLADYPEFKQLKSIICDRKVYRDALSEGRGVVEMDNSKALSEIKALVQEVLQ
ncbi:MAG: AAA family ATPase [Candidatus Thiodiazotropha taylori]|nr:AAA family ATPase [Candidatus Thiodiazotropha taylori]MCW4297075.1 AAA family ATPase [Candidatus Thiodiazotropha endolucinida]MCG8115168.1 AAA family ATPase [Candidatus Thiodiazotropha taylori]MCG8121382.1 AAA family ATPase [Candidatus Thiodiazotropha taylori]MCW4299461.1 AAA family ATPase [Candidatus Thiodiazotropha endolucinida]